MKTFLPLLLTMAALFAVGCREEIVSCHDCGMALRKGEAKAIPAAASWSPDKKSDRYFCAAHAPVCDYIIDAWSGLVFYRNPQPYQVDRAGASMEPASRGTNRVEWVEIHHTNIVTRIQYVTNFMAEPQILKGPPADPWPHFVLPRSYHLPYWEAPPGGIIISNYFTNGAFFIFETNLLPPSAFDP